MITKSPKNRKTIKAIIIKKKISMVAKPREAAPVFLLGAGRLVRSRPTLYSLFLMPSHIVPDSSLRVYCGGFNEEVSVIDMDSVSPESVAGDIVFGAIQLERPAVP